MQPYRNGTLPYFHTREAFRRLKEVLAERWAVAAGLGRGIVCPWDWRWWEWGLHRLPEMPKMQSTKLGMSRRQLLVLKGKKTGNLGC